MSNISFLLGGGGGHGQLPGMEASVGLIRWAWFQWWITHSWVLSYCYLITTQLIFNQILLFLKLKQSFVDFSVGNHLWLLSVQIHFSRSFSLPSFSPWEVTHPFPCKSCVILSLSQATLLRYFLSSKPGLPSPLPRVTQVWLCLPPLFLISCKILFMSVKFYLVSLASHCLGLSELFGSWLCHPV